MTKNRNISDILDQHSQFIESIGVGNDSINVVVNSTTFTGTANNALYLGGVAAAGYQSVITVSTSDPSGGSDGDVWVKDEGVWKQVYSAS